MSAKPMPALHRLIALIDYNPKTGEMFWKPRAASDFPCTKYPARNAKIFNTKYAGKPCCIATHLDGGRQAVVEGWHGLAIRVAWKITHGDDPECVIAINGDKTDLRASNLRASYINHVAKNQSMFAHNTSGVRGVIWDQSRNLWRAEIKTNGRVIYLGRFKHLEQAATARQLAEVKHGFARNSAGNMA